MTRLYRSETDRMLGGVCGGIAEVYELDPSVVRLVTLALILTGVSPLIYLVAWLIIPSESEVEKRGKQTTLDDTEGSEENEMKEVDVESSPEDEEE